MTCDLLEERASRTAEEFGAEGYCTDYREVLARKDLDLVCIFTKVDSHAEIAIAAAQQGRHVFVQKPFARTLREGQAMVDAARSSQTLLITSFMHSYFDESLAAAEWVRSGRIGNVEFVRQRNATGNARETAPSYGGALMDIGSHGIDLVRAVTGMNIVAVCAHIGPDVSLPPGVSLEWDDPFDRPLVGGEANAFLMYKMENGAVVNHEVQWAARGGTAAFQMEIYGSMGSLFLRIPRTGADFAACVVTDAGGRRSDWSTPKLPGLPRGYAHHRAVLDAVIAGDAGSPGARGMAVLDVVAAARRSVDVNGWVRL